MGLPFDPVISLLGIYPKNPKTLTQKEYMHPYVHCGIIYNSQDLETSQVFISGEWEKQLWFIYTMKYYTAERKKEVLPFTTAWMELETIKKSEISQSAKDEHHVTSLVTGI